MGFPLEPAEAPQPEHHPPKDLQKYYSDLYREAVEKHASESYDVKQTMSSIFSRTKVPTRTHGNRELALLDVDKLLAFNTKSINEKDDRVKYMRMVSGLMQQSERTGDNPAVRQMQHLVRMARLHFLSQGNAMQDEDEDRNA